MTRITATYSPEDNKLRLYASTRLDAETYAQVKAAGFQWAPKQQLFVAPKWTPEREDLAMALAGDIEAEEMTLAERAAIKAERLDALAGKRYAQANAYAARADDLSQAFANGQPILVGHHSERKARKTQERMHSAMDQSVKAHKAANYWLYRAEGVERFANMKNAPRVRANRIKTLLAELRDLQRAINTAQAALALWDRAQTDDQIRHIINNTDSSRTHAGWNAYSDLRNGAKTPQEIRADAIASANRVANGPNRRRWIEHTLNRLAFERSMLGDVPRYDGTLTPVILQAFARTHGAEKPVCTATAPDLFALQSPVDLPAHIASGNQLELPGDAWRDLMQSVGYVVPDPVTRRKSSKPAPLPLINPSQEQAEQLQRLWNLRMVKACEGKHQAKANEVRALTQARYSANSKGEYAPLKTIDIDADGRQVRGSWKNQAWTLSGVPVARIRIYTGGSGFYQPNAVVHITDKPSKPLPFDLDALEAALHPQPEAQAPGAPANAGNRQQMELAL